MPLQRHIHAPDAQVLLEIPELPIDVLIAALLGRVHMIQFVKDHVKGVL